MDQNRPKLALIDGTYYIFRAFYGLKQQLTSSSGQPTNAVFAFKNMMIQLLKELSPTYIGVVFDSNKPGFRDKLYPQYKAHRQEPPPELKSQFDLIFELVEKIGLKLIIDPGTEADDIIGSLTEKFQEHYDVWIISADKDLTQLIKGNVHMYDSMRKVTYNAAVVKEKFGVYPQQIPDYLALVGDSSDNIPGVAGIGKVSAAKLLSSYNSIQEIKDNIDNLPTTLSTKIKNSWDNLLISEQLTKIDCKVNLDINIKQLLPTAIDQNNLNKLYQKLNFSADYFLKKSNLDQQAIFAEKSTNLENEHIATPITDNNHKVAIDRNLFVLINEQQQLIDYLKYAQQKGLLCLDFETTSLEIHYASLVGVAIKTMDQAAAYIPIAHQEDNIKQLPLDFVLKELQNILADQKLVLIGQNIKYELNILRKYNITVSAKIEDTMLQSYLIYSDSHKHNLDDLAQKLLGHQNIQFSDVAGKGKDQITFDKVPVKKALAYAAEDAEVTFNIYLILKKQIEKLELSSIYYDIELQIVRILAEMEYRGVKIDVKHYQNYSQQLSAETKKLANKIQQLSPEAFNINSPKQLSYILFDKMGIKNYKFKTKTGFSTDQKVLEKLAAHYEIADYILQFRLKNKLINTYLDVFPKLVNKKTGRIHTSYNQTVAATGRLSSSNPNLQNIPVRGAERAILREGIIADADKMLIAADYSQIELRILAHLSQDHSLLEAFNNREDIHSRTAATLFNIRLSEVNNEQRSIAKAINFGLMYGMGPHKLANTININYKSAKKYIDDYFKKFASIKNYMQQTIDIARQNLYTTTLFGRKRLLQDINASNTNNRKAAERIAMNTPIQGTAADIIKLAMIKLDKNIKKEFPDPTNRPAIILQVHDELVLEAAPNIVAKTKEILVDSMEHAAQLSVPLEVSCQAGQNWALAANH